jgi:Bacterial PH domain
VQWSPRRTQVAVLVLIGLGLALAAVFLDTAGRVLVGAAAVLALSLALRDGLARPRLSAGPDGVHVRTGLTRKHLPWRRLQVRVGTNRRLGLRSTVLELDTAAGPDDDGVLVLLGRWDLGADPADVARALRALDPSAG